MSFKFNQAFDKLAESFAIPQSDHELFLERVDIIKNKILQKMDEINSVFKGMILNLEETAYYEKGSYIDLPIDFNAFLKLKMPFKIEPDFQSSPLRAVQLRTKVNHPIVDDGVINTNLFKFLMGRELMKAITSMGSITCKDGAVFKLFYEEDTLSYNHTITAITERQADVNKIIFSFMPAIMIIKDESTPLPSWIWSSENQRYWLALSYTGHGERYHFGINHKWQNVTRSQKKKAKNLMLLLQKILGQVFDLSYVEYTKLFIFNWSDLLDRESILNDPLGSLFMELLFLLRNCAEDIFGNENPALLPLTALLSSARLNQIHLKFQELQSGQKKFKVDDIKALFGI